MRALLLYASKCIGDTSARSITRASLKHPEDFPRLADSNLKNGSEPFR